MLKRGIVSWAGLKSRIEWVFGQSVLFNFLPLPQGVLHSIPAKPPSSPLILKDVRTLAVHQRLPDDEVGAAFTLYSLLIVICALCCLVVLGT